MSTPTGRGWSATVRPDAEHVWVGHKFTGAAQALRRDVFLQLGGFRESLVHFGEEDDYCIRLLAAGYVTRQGRADPAFHKLSPVRNRRRERHDAVRNVIYWSWLNVPAWRIVPQLAVLTAREALYAVKYRMPWVTLKGILGGYRDSFLGNEEAPADSDSGLRSLAGDPVTRHGEAGRYSRSLASDTAILNALHASASRYTPRLANSLDFPRSDHHGNGTEARRHRPGHDQ